MNFTNLGYIRVAALSPEVAIGNPPENARRIVEAVSDTSLKGVSLVLLPELCISAYTCEDLFHSQDLLDQCVDALATVADAARDKVIVAGAPWRLADGRLVNAAFVCSQGEIVGAVPKSFHPNYGEFYDYRWFVSGEGLDIEVKHALLGEFRLSSDQLFELHGTRFAIEICEDLWSPRPPGARHALAGADLILNLSASNELVGKHQYRRNLVSMASATSICAYLYCSAGPTESSKDVVYGGHCMMAENGVIIAESERFSIKGSRVICEFDRQKLRHDRGYNRTFAQSKRPQHYRTVAVSMAQPGLDGLKRCYSPSPFVPEDKNEFESHAREILQIQSLALARRILAANCQTLLLGLSGGLDSTLALMVCLDALRLLDRKSADTIGVTMPGPGTSSHTHRSVKMLADATGIELREIPIGDAVELHLKDISHKGEADIVFENAQARERTQILFDLANQEKGIVVGTGDLSELALGWCTYNADHMSNYNVNASVPKTLVKYLLRWYADNRASKALTEALIRVLDTPISPELLPNEKDSVVQETESIIGPYELHDFFLYHLLRNGFSVIKIYTLALHVFKGRYSAGEVRQWLRVFIRRFYQQQFKRTVVPAGPKVGSVSLSPRGDWRMPDEADSTALLAMLEKLPSTEQGE